MTNKPRKSRKRRAKGEGSIRFDVKNERWVGSFQPERGPRKYVAGQKGESQASFLKKFDAAKRKAVKFTSASNCTFGEFLEERWLTSIKGQVRPRTYESYKVTVDQYLAESIGTVRLRELTRDHIAKAMTDARVQGRSTRTVNYVRSIARLALGVAVDDGLLDCNVATLAKPDSSKTGQAKSVMQHYTAQEVKLIAETAADVRNGLLVVVGALLGLRRGELCGLQWCDYNEEVGTIAVRRQVLRYERKLHVDELKTDRSHRLLRVPPSLAVGLERHRRAQKELRLRTGEAWRDEGFIFAEKRGGPLDPRNAQRLFVRVVRKAEVPIRRLHDLRHTCATLQLEMGTPVRVVADMLGHSSTRVTNDVYAHVTPVMMDAAVEKMERILSGKN